MKIDLCIGTLYAVSKQRISHTTHSELVMDPHELNLMCAFPKKDNMTRKKIITFSQWLQYLYSCSNRCPVLNVILPDYKIVGAQSSFLVAIKHTENSSFSDGTNKYFGHLFSGIP